MLIANERLVDRCMAVGGKIYPPLAPGLSRDKWERHYGATWQRFAAAKKRFDPHHVLTPGIDLFA
jgi:FAD/FMN-containing dehydrogenase